MAAILKAYPWSWLACLPLTLQAANGTHFNANEKSPSEAVVAPGFQRKPTGSVRISEAHGYFRGYGLRVQSGSNLCRQNLLQPQGAALTPVYGYLRSVGESGESYGPLPSKTNEIRWGSSAFLRGSYPLLDKLKHVVLLQGEYGAQQSSPSFWRNPAYVSGALHWRTFFSKEKRTFGLGIHGVSATKQVLQDLFCTPSNAQIQYQLRYMHQVGLQAEIVPCDWMRGSGWFRMPLFQGALVNELPKETQAKDQDKEKVQAIAALQTPTSFGGKLQGLILGWCSSWVQEEGLKRCLPFVEDEFEFKGWLGQRLLKGSSLVQNGEGGGGFGVAKGIKINILGFKLSIGLDSYWDLGADSNQSKGLNLIKEISKKLFWGNFYFSGRWGYRKDMALQGQYLPSSQQQRALKTSRVSRCDCLENLNPELLWAIQEERSKASEAEKAKKKTVKTEEPEKQISEILKNIKKCEEDFKKTEASFEKQKSFLYPRFPEGVQVRDHVQSLKAGDHNPWCKAMQARFQSAEDFIEKSLLPAMNQSLQRLQGKTTQAEELELQNSRRKSKHEVAKGSDVFEPYNLETLKVHIQEEEMKVKELCSYLKGTVEKIAEEAKPHQAHFNTLGQLLEKALDPSSVPLAAQGSVPCLTEVVEQARKAEGWLRGALLIHKLGESLCEKLEEYAAYFDQTLPWVEGGDGYSGAQHALACMPRLSVTFFQTEDYLGNQTLRQLSEHLELLKNPKKELEKRKQELNGLLERLQKIQSHSDYKEKLSVSEKTLVQTTYESILKLQKNLGEFEVGAAEQEFYNLLVGQYRSAPSLVNLKSL